MELFRDEIANTKIKYKSILVQIQREWAVGDMGGSILVCLGACMYKTKGMGESKEENRNE